MQPSVEEAPCDAIESDAANNRPHTRNQIAMAHEHLALTVRQIVYRSELLVLLHTAVQTRNVATTSMQKTGANYKENELSTWAKTVGSCRQYAAIVGPLILESIAQP